MTPSQILVQSSALLHTPLLHPCIGLCVSLYIRCLMWTGTVLVSSPAMVWASLLQNSGVETWVLTDCPCSLPRFIGSPLCCSLLPHTATFPPFSHILGHAGCLLMGPWHCLFPWMDCPSLRYPQGSYTHLPRVSTQMSRPQRGPSCSKWQPSSQPGLFPSSFYSYQSIFHHLTFYVICLSFSLLLFSPDRTYSPQGQELFCSWPYPECLQQGLAYRFEWVSEWVSEKITELMESLS